MNIDSAFFVIGRRSCLLILLLAHLTLVESYNTMTRLSSLVLLVSLLLASTSATRITLLGRSDSDYTPFSRTLQREFGSSLTVRVNDDLSGSDYAVHLPGGDYSFLASSPIPVLTIAAELDGVTRFSLFAVQRHQHAHRHRFVVVGGASHHSFARTSWKGLDLDLQAEITDNAAQQHAATLIHEWVRTSQGNSTTGTKLLEAAELRAAQLATPIVKALQLEGSAALGQDICNSDFPTNPSCNYPKYPDFSLPPGPKPAPSPLPSSDCVCGSQWVTSYAFPAVSGAAEKGFTVHAADAFHDVSC